MREHSGLASGWLDMNQAVRHTAPHKMSITALPEHTAHGRSIQLSIVNQTLCYLWWQQSRHVPVYLSITLAATQLGTGVTLPAYACRHSGDTGAAAVC